MSHKQPLATLHVKIGALSFFGVTRNGRQKTRLDNQKDRIEEINEQKRDIWRILSLESLPRAFVARGRAGETVCPPKPNSRGGCLVRTR